MMRAGGTLPLAGRVTGEARGRCVRHDALQWAPIWVLRRLRGHVAAVGKMDMFGSAARAEAGRALHADIVAYHWRSPGRRIADTWEFAQLPLSIAAVRSSLETAGDGWRRLETAGDGWRRLEMAETGGDGVYWSATVM